MNATKYIGYRVELCAWPDAVREIRAHLEKRQRMIGAKELSVLIDTSISCAENLISAYKEFEHLIDDRHRAMYGVEVLQPNVVGAGD